MTLCVQADVENTLQITFTNQPEATITYLIDGATQAIKTHVDRELEEATYTNELYDSPWGRTLIKLRNYPVTAVTEVIENDVILVEGDSYEFYVSGNLARINGRLERRWQAGRKIIDVTYTAGYSTATLPKDIRNICAGIVARHFRAGADFAATPAAAGPIRSVSLDGSDSIEYADPPDMGAVGHAEMLTGQDKMGLSRYQRRMTL